MSATLKRSDVIESTAPAPRWARFSLRSLFFTTLVCAVGLAVLIVPSVRELQAIAHFDRLGVPRVPSSGRAADARWSWIPFHGIHYASWLPEFLEDESLRELCPQVHQIWFVEGDELGDAELPPLRACTRLQALHLPSTKLTDAGLRPLAGLRKLEFLSLQVANLTDAGCAHFCRLPKLKHLALGPSYGRGKSHVTEAGLRRLAQLPSLTSLELSQLDLNEAGIAALGDLTQLEQLTFFEVTFPPNGLAELRVRLPQCAIETEPVP